MDYKKYIVPIYTSKEPKSEPSVSNCYGTGFIIGKYLITAGHVVDGFDYVWYKFDGFYHQLTNPIDFELGREECYRIEQLNAETTIRVDLAIYEIGECGSPLQLGWFRKGITCVYYGYTLTDNSVQECFFESLPLYKNIRHNDLILANCNFLECKDIVPGNSGGPLLDENKVVGMVVADYKRQDGTLKGCCSLSSLYIRYKLSSLK